MRRGLIWKRRMLQTGVSVGQREEHDTSNRPENSSGVDATIGSEKHELRV
jgi:hypothetical protein